jgi:glycosyltransferase involved in cell wall biosynthesis
LQSVQDIADEIWVVDSFSTDKTKEICLSYGVQFIEHRFEGHIQQKNFAAQNATCNYVLSLDADEVLSPQHIKSIKEVKLNFEADGYYFNRLNNYCGQWIKHCGWYPDKKLRIWDRRNLMFIPNRIDS